MEAKNFLEGIGFVIETKQEKYELVITSDSITSTDDRFTMDNLGLGDNYQPLDAYFKNSEGEIVRRKFAKGERRNSNQTMPRLVCQVFERSLAALSMEEKEIFPVCQYAPNQEILCGIFPSIEKYRAYHNSIEYTTYSYGSGKLFVFYSWNIFSTVLFVQECLKRFGKEGDEFILIYREKDKKEVEPFEEEESPVVEPDREFNGYMNPYSYIYCKGRFSNLPNFM